jgi:transposase
LLDQESIEEERRMRVTTLFKRLLRLEGARVVAVELEGEPGAERVVVDLARPQRRWLRCPRCGYRTRASYDHSLRTLRHLDVLRTPCLLRLEVRRLACPECGVVSEELPFARAGSRFTRAFEDTCVWLARDAPKTVVARLLRVDWATVGRMIERVVAEAATTTGEQWLQGLRRIGIDEVSYRKGRRYLLCVVCHDSGRIVWAQPGHSRSVLHAFFDELGEQRCALLEAVSADLGPAWQEVIRERAPNALVCADPFHVIKLAGEALDTLRRQDWQRLRKQDPRRAIWLKGTRFVLRQRADTLTAGQRDLIAELAETNERVYRGWLLCDQLRAVFSADGDAAPLLLDEWLHAAASSLLVPFVKLARTLSEHRDGIVNAIRLRLSNARLEAMNSTVRLISHRSRGFRRLDSLLAPIRLVCGRVPIALPT